MENKERMERVLQFLDAHGFAYKIVHHPPLHTVEDALPFWESAEGLPGCTHCKNLFLRNHSGKRHYLVTMECHKSLDFVLLQQIVGEGKLSFASEERMERCLGLRPGSVSPLGLINDMNLTDANPRELFENGHRVKLFVDSDLREAPMVTFHPCDNRASVALSHTEFHRFLETWGGEVEWINVTA